VSDAAATLLVIDDEPEVLAATARILTQAGYRVITGGTAAEAVDLTQEHRPAIVFLDVVLQDGDGMQVAQQLKSDPTLAGVFVVLLSGQKTSGEDQAEGLASGLADGYIVRPFSKPEFLARVDALLRLRSAQEALRDALHERDALLEAARKAESELRQMARAVEQTPASILITDRTGNIAYVNAYFEAATGYTKAEAIGKNPRILKSGMTPPGTYDELWSVISAGGEWRGELCNRRKNGEIYWEYAAISGLKDERGQVSHYIAVKDDVTDRKRNEEALRVSLREKESLLRETHHRVKNNLALIASLMRLEAGRSREPGTKAVLTEMQTRIRSVVLLNETLYKTASYSRVALGDYVRQVANHVFEAQNANSGAARLVLDLEPVEVETGQAIPCGLIVNELLTNSLKHAFPNGRSGEVRVALRQQAGGSVCLRVSDTGAGLPEDFASRQGNSLGLQLVSDLARQLLGALDIGPGPTFTVTFSRGRNETGAIPYPTSTRRRNE
jgi:PAS domain S-box-containing protein